MADTKREATTLEKQADPLIKEVGISSKQTNGKKQPGRKQNIFSLILIIVNILLIVTLLGVTIVWRVRKEELYKPTQPELCVPVTDLTDQSFCNKKKTTSGDPKTCCGDASAVLNHLTEQAVRRVRKEDEIYDQFIPPEVCDTRQVSKPSAKFSGITEGDSDNPHLLHWKADKSKAFNNYGISYSGGRITVNETGFYFIYSQIEFRDESDTLADTGVWHYMYKMENDGQVEEKLIEGSKSGCKHLPGSKTTTSHIGAVFKLNASDVVYVHASHPSHITDTDKGNFFGLHMI